ncbi:hypothetical protein C8A00DRAFT_19368 [Chaetomidium leptoderma]|uniref:Uncharacterized protein n=1 Tax=Chaetomidium leptoderma TaxID=669021 RepID=A0AAN6VCG3_9PEZI|nr:hypothetical protein C8A00DRAFT_19368 [Chaetomidium leptoderma]
MHFSTLLTLAAASLASASTIPAVEQRQEGPGECDLSCRPGQFCCYNRGDKDVLMVCNSLSRFVLSAECGSVGCCSKRGPADSVFCIC